MTTFVLGNPAGSAYYALFQIAGIILITMTLKKNRTAEKLLLGSSLGSLLFAWLPILFSFILGFNGASHLLALACLLPVFYLGIRQKAWQQLSAKELKESILQHRGPAIFAGFLFILWCYLLYTHIILPGDDGAIYTGQCTYGDMNMHLGFITSIARGDCFPPEYSIFPGTKLAYPFLSASVSSSLLVCGASLRYAYIFPMLFAFLQIMGYVYLLAYRLAGSCKKATLAFALFFLNGGFGIVYFLPFFEKHYTLRELFEGFYITPTNLIDKNIRWVNTIADMFLPQRATLFGYATLVAFLYLLFCAYEQKKTRLFVLCALFAGGLPLIHTHSFLAAGLCSACFLFYELWNTLSSRKKLFMPAPIVVFVISMIVLCIVQTGWTRGIVAPDMLMNACLAFVGAFILVAMAILPIYITIEKRKTLQTWGIFLFFSLFFSLPQLFGFTFGQVSDGGFVRGHFGWGNLFDFHPWFYVKNLGMPLLLFLGSLISKKKSHSPILLFMYVTWMIAELVVFTPNTYDNNKLLYVVYLFMCIYAADFAVDILQKIRPVFGRTVATILLCLLCFVSGILTLGREAISRYQLYGKDMCALASYVEENTLNSAVILTGDRHNNEIASLTGRNIVCGADTFLYYHGIDTSARKQDVRQMYETPALASALFEQYGVTHVVISGYERSDYIIDEMFFFEHFPVVFLDGNTLLFEISTEEK